MNEEVSASSTEKSDLEDLRGLIIMGNNSNELVLPYLEGLNVTKGRLEKLKKYISAQKQDKKNRLLLDLIEKISEKA